MLRHPVVITSLEEDFKKIGLLKEDKDPAPEEPVEASADDVEEDEDLDDDEAEEALAQAEAFARQWDEDEGVEEFILTQEEMDALESMGTVEEEYDDDEEDDSDLDEDEDLDEDSFLASFDEAFFDDLELDEDELSEKYGDDVEARQAEMFKMMQVLEGRRRKPGGRGMVKTKRMSSKAKMKARRYYKAHKRKIAKQRRKRAKTGHGRQLARVAKSVESVSEISNILEHIDSLVADLHEEVTVETAQPAFANIALVAEMLVQLFDSTLDEDADSSVSDSVQTYTDLAEAAAEAVEFLHDHDGEDDLDEEAMSEAYSAYLDVLREGISAYQELSAAFLEDDDSDTEGNEEDAA